jgi:hypothetical protein
MRTGFWKGYLDEEEIAGGWTEQYKKELHNLYCTT